MGSQTGVVVLLGPPGSGRTRLARLTAPGAIEVRCHPGLAHRSHGAFRAVFDGLERGPDALAVVDAVLARLGGEPLVIADLDQADRPTILAVERLADQVPLLVTIDPDGPAAACALQVVRSVGAQLHHVPADDECPARQVAAAVPRVLAELGTDPACSALGLALVGRPTPVGLLPYAAQLVDAGLAVTLGGEVAIRHRLVAGAVIDAFDPVEHRSMHAQLVDIVAPLDAGGAARHALAAGDGDRASALALAAAETAPEPSERALHLEVAALAGAGPDVDLDAAEALVAAGWPERAEPLVAPVAPHAEKPGEPGEAGARATVVLARADAARGRLADARARLERALDHRHGDGSLDSGAEARLRLALAELAVAHNWQAAGAVALAREAVDAAGRSADAAVEARAAAVLARALLADRHPPEHPDVVAALAAGPADGVADAAYVAHTLYGDLAEAASLARAERRRCVAVGDRAGELAWRLRAAHVELFAEARFRPALAELRRLAGEPLLAAQREHLDAITIIAMSDLGQEAAWRRLLHERWGPQPEAPLLRWALAAAEFNAGRYGAALAAATRDRGSGGAVEPLVEVIERWCLLLRRQAVPDAPLDPGFPNLAAAGHEAEALARWSAGDPAGAEPAFAAAAVRWQGVITRNVWRAQLGQAECRRQAGDVGGAVELFRSVSDETRARGLVVIVRRAEAGLRRCGAEPKARRRPGLTPREALVLERVAAGATSVDIAAELQVTARTIDKTVARAMRKLGASTRHQAARLAAGGQVTPPEAPTLSPADLPADTLALLRRIAAGETISAASRNVGLSRRTATRRLGELRARLGVTTTAGILDALDGRGPDQRPSSSTSTPSAR